MQNQEPHAEHHVANFFVVDGSADFEANFVGPQRGN